VQQGRGLADPGRHDDHVTVEQVIEGVEGAAALRLVHLLQILHCRLLSLSCGAVFLSSIAGYARMLTGS
jgi:hypothetical protein